MAAYSDLQADVEYARKLAVGRLGPGTKVSMIEDGGGWMASREDDRGTTRVTAHDLPTLTWFLEQMPERKVEGA